MTATMKGCVNATSEADSYEQASAFLSNWFQASLLVPPTSTAAAAHEPQHRPNRRRTLTVPDASRRTLSRRNTWNTSDGNINSLLNSLHHVQEQHQTHRLSHQISRRSTNQSPLSVDEVFHDESVSSGGGSGAFPPLPFRKQSRQSQHQPQQSTVPSSSSNPSNKCRFTPRSSSRHRSNGERSNGEKKSSSESSSARPSKSTSSSRKQKFKSQSDNKATAAEGKSSSTAKSTTTKHTTSSAQPSTQRPFDRLSELDGPRFDLGDTFRHPKHQIIESDTNKALELIAQLRIHDFAWILRSTREWTYAIVADFPTKGEEDESILFVLDKAGNTKTLKRKHWAQCIRLVDQKL